MLFNKKLKLRKMHRKLGGEYVGVGVRSSALLIYYIHILPIVVFLCIAILMNNKTSHNTTSILAHIFISIYIDNSKYHVKNIIVNCCVYCLCGVLHLGVFLIVEKNILNFDIICLSALCRASKAMLFDRKINKHKYKHKLFCYCFAK